MGAALKILILESAFCLFFPSIFSDQILHSSRKIDELIRKGYEERGIKPVAPATDEVFLRRVYLDISGAIPSYQQTLEFLNSKDPQKRWRLIDRLLKGPGYVSHFYNFWGDLLRIKSRIKGIPRNEYSNWIKEALKENRPYDKMVYQLLTASGNSHDTGAVGYYLRDEGRILETFSTTAQAFLGTQIGCAQCHNHPFDDWKQMQFFQMAAYMGETTTRGYGRKKIRGLLAKYKEYKLTDTEKQALRRLFRLSNAKVGDRRGKKLRLPEDYKYKDAEPKSIVSPAVLFGKQPTPEMGESQRDTFARWLTSSENPLFTKIIVNRLWKKIMGFGLFEPIDDWNDETEVVYPTVLEVLEKEMIRLKYDLKEFIKILFNTRTYQLSTSPEEMKFKTYAAQAAPLRRMSAEQVWDSLLTLLVKDINQLKPRVRSLNARNQIIMEVQAGTLKFEEPEKMILRVRETLKMMKKRRGKKASDMMMDDPGKRRGQKNSKKNKKGRKKRAGRIGGGLLGRAANLPSPAPFGHLIDLFGQSGREIIEEGNRDPTIPQVLKMMNGKVLYFLTRPFSNLIKNGVTGKTVEERAKILYLSILTRFPTKKEIEIIQKEVKKYGDKGYENIIWALLNSREFLFVK